MCEERTTSKEYIKLSSHLKCPEGYVGWVADVNPDVSMKLYMANLSPNIVDNLYTDFMGSISLKYLQLYPKDAADDTLSAIFSRNKSFSDHFTHEYFVVKEVETGYTLLDLLNFVPKMELQETFHNEESRNKHLLHHDHILESFISAFKAFQSGQLCWEKERRGYGNEELDVDTTVQLALAFGPGVVSTLREVGIACTRGRSGPHGYIDLVVYSEDKFPNVILAIQEFKAGDSNAMEVERLSATSVKTADTFHSKGSDRQCVVEILALSQVLLASNPDIELVAFLKACKTMFCLYIYYPKFDLLAKTTHIGLKQCLPGIQHNEPQKMMGYFTFFLMLNHQFNHVFPQDLSQNIKLDFKCGWKGNVNPNTYLPFLMPQKLRKSSAKDQPTRSAKKRKITNYSDPVF